MPNVVSHHKRVGEGEPSQIWLRGHWRACSTEIGVLLGVILCDISPCALPVVMTE